MTVWLIVFVTSVLSFFLGYTFGKDDRPWVADSTQETEE